MSATPSPSSSRALGDPPNGTTMRPSVDARGVALIVAVLLVGLGFICSYVGAFHDPTPHRVRLAVVAPAQSSAQLVGRLNALPGAPLRAGAAASEAAARRSIRHNDVAGALVVAPSGTRDQLLTASGGGAALTTALTQVVQRVESRQGRTVATTDIVPLQRGDFRGLTGFYTVVGWLVAGYLLASLLGIVAGARVSTPRSVAARLLVLVPYSVAAGLGGMLVIDTALGAQTGSFLALSGIGALLVFSAAGVTIALQELLGIVGIGVAIVLFVVLGNPSAGGAYQLPLLPGFWRTIGDALPNGAGVDAIRRIVYFGGHGIAGHLVLIAGYCVAAVLVAMAPAAARSRRSAEAGRG